MPKYRRVVEQEIFVWEGEPVEELPKPLRGIARKTKDGLLIQGPDGPELCEPGGWIATNSRKQFFTIPIEQRGEYEPVLT
jgi:hypothetical protein